MSGPSRTRSSRLLAPLFSALVGGLLVALVIVLVQPGSSTVTKTVKQSPGVMHLASTSTQPMTAAQIYSQDAAGVVSIQASSDGGGSGPSAAFGAPSSQQSDTGSGIVVATSGLILTNDHVVSGASTLTVTLGGSGGPTRNATLVGEDPSTDLALLRIDPSGLNLKALPLADSSSVTVGDSTYAIGNPFGLDRTLTTGVVSALQREIQAPDGQAIHNVIQTDAALNPGNSGGPLLNTAGQVIGVNSQIATSQSQGGLSSSGGGNTGIGFAVPSNTVKSVLQRLEHNGGVSPSSTPTI